MERATPLSQQKFTQPSSRLRPIAVFGLTAAGILVVAYIALASLLSASVTVSPNAGSKDVAVTEQIKVSASWMRGSISSVTVKETSLDPLGNPVSDRTIEGALEKGIFVPVEGGQLLTSDARYDVTVNATLTDLTLTGPRRHEITETFSFQTITTPAPIFLNPVQVVALGQPIVVEFNTPIDDFSYELTPGAATKSRIDNTNQSRAFIEMEDYEQGQSYSLTITQARTKNGAELRQPMAQTINTTEPLKVVFVPGDGESGVSAAARPSLTFTEPIKNPEIADSLITIEPALQGGWEWHDDNQTVEFKPINDWTQGETVTIRLKGGPQAFRGASGSYLREDVSSSFNVKPSKRIDVNLTTQTLTLYDNDQPVKTMLVSSGKEATPSLTGTYAVYAKADKLDMRGEGYFVRDVPWVLMFNGDYTIHGNYWTTTFGVPSSNGCVGLPVPDAEFVYNWTPIGTIVNIYY
ncbi:MAG: L,D-transpeptidase family protein [Thermoleophilia bacterium]|nr:L,D-transpeptidase family protein [Thermoleophilia bacterium]